jgi:2-iminobutanoate/2-iminopropanoate deaminase
MENKKLEIIHTDKAPQAIGPYSQAIKFERMIFTSGQLGINPATGQLASDDIAGQTEQVLTNLENILISCNSGLENVIETTIYLASMNDFSTVNKIYSSRMKEHKPARATVQVAALPLNARIEIKMTAAV